VRSWAVGELVTEETLRAFATGELPSYQVPRLVVFVESIPRNAMGKINKKQLLKDLFPQSIGGP
jgi:acyl-CoA synthetase (AMP-forming)/AMP-acid ligase II